MLFCNVVESTDALVHVCLDILYCITHDRSNDFSLHYGQSKRVWQATTVDLFCLFRSDYLLVCVFEYGVRVDFICTPIGPN